ncbi:TolC family protein [Spirosoma harenae]
MATLLLLPVARTVAQTADSVVFSAADFYGAITQFHPLVRLSSLLSQEAQREVMQARGAFDPKLFSYYDKKQFGNTLYYDKWQSGLAVPLLPGGIDLKVAHDRNVGYYLNPENRLATPGLTSVGLTVPIGQGFLIDERRNTLRQSQLALTLADAERAKLINKTLFDAAKTYWDWFFAFQQYRLIDEGYRLADTRFRATRDRALLGDVAAIDTTEALITVQDRQVQREQSLAMLQNTRIRLMAFLWNAEREPVNLPENVIPQTVLIGRQDEAILQNLLTQAVETHPELTKLQTKERQLAVEERFRRSLLMPRLNVSASLLSGIPILGESNGLPSYYNFRTDNYKIGVEAAFPLFLRKERGKLQQVQIKAQQINLELQQTSRDIANDVKTSWNELKALERQVSVQQQTVQNQLRLVQAEQQKFEIGESSLFLINTRETKLIDLQVKWEEMKSKYQKAIADLYYRAGTVQ